MIEIIPSINSETWDEVQAFVHKIEEASDWVEIDVLDGTLSRRRTWNNPPDLKTLAAPAQLHIAAHLLVAHPEQSIKVWIGAGVRRIIVQWEGVVGQGLSRFFPGRAAEKTMEKMKNLCADNWVQFGVSIGQKTGVQAIKNILRLVDIVQILNPAIGVSGEAFHPELLAKVQQLSLLKQQYPFKIEWDGGVNVNSIATLVKYKVDIAVSTSFVFRAPNPAQALEALRRQVLL